MARGVLISCVSRKLDRPAKARDLYTSALFRKALTYAESQKPDWIAVLSAKYGIVPLEKRIAPYDETLNEKGDQAVRMWAKRVLRALGPRAKDDIVMLAGERYRRYLEPHLPRVKVPMRRLGIGKQLRYLTRHTP